MVFGGRGCHTTTWWGGILERVRVFFGGYISLEVRVWQRARENRGLLGHPPVQVVRQRLARRAAEDEEVTIVRDHRVTVALLRGRRGAAQNVLCGDSSPTEITEKISHKR